VRTGRRGPLAFHSDPFYPVAMIDEPALFRLRERAGDIACMRREAIAESHAAGHPAWYEGPVLGEGIVR